MGVAGDVLSPHPKAWEHGQPSGLQGQLGACRVSSPREAAAPLSWSILPLPAVQIWYPCWASLLQELLGVSMGSMEFAVWQPQMRGGVWCALLEMLWRTPSLGQGCVSPCSLRHGHHTCPLRRGSEASGLYLGHGHLASRTRQVQSGALLKKSGARIGLPSRPSLAPECGSVRGIWSPWRCQPRSAVLWAGLCRSLPEDTQVTELRVAVRPQGLSC